MAMYINKAALEKSAGLRAQHEFIVNSRKAAFRYNRDMAERAGLAANVDIPSEAWKAFDASAVDLMIGPEADTLLADLMPLARNVGIGKIVAEYRKLGGELEVRSSIDGEHAKPVNSTGFDVDGNLVLVHSTQVGRSWRELEGMREEGFDELIVDQAAAVRNVRMRTADNFVNGTAGLSFKGYESTGIKNNPNTQPYNLTTGGFDLTDASITYADAYAALVGALRLLPDEANIYVSNDIWFNLMRINTAGTAQETILAGLQRTPGVLSIKRISQLTGNEFIAVVPQSQYVRPVVGMPITTTPIERRTPMDKFNLLVWGASGLEIRGDAEERSGVVYAADGAGA